MGGVKSRSSKYGTCVVFVFPSHTFQYPKVQKFSFVALNQKFLFLSARVHPQRFCCRVCREDSDSLYSPWILCLLLCLIQLCQLNLFCLPPRLSWRSPAGLSAIIKKDIFKSENLTCRSICNSGRKRGGTDMKDGEMLVLSLKNINGLNYGFQDGKPIFLPIQGSNLLTPCRASLQAFSVNVQCVLVSQCISVTNTRRSETKSLGPRNSKRNGRAE